ncbi:MULTISPECIES: hypothetical protein [Nocardia]|uniref:hypothetical protein n=1 Tax=Nocardia TaxID=1817 RepID=UPI00135C39BD|nr:MULTISPECIES: hypothetical protein [Nocardia]MBF6202681.1 hypothetical protein [Streptomyces gardneri]
MSIESSASRFTAHLQGGDFCFWQVPRQQTARRHGRCFRSSLRAWLSTFRYFSVSGDDTTDKLWFAPDQLRH